MAKPIWKVEVGDERPRLRVAGDRRRCGPGGPKKMVRLSDYRGRNVVLAFYPAAFTPV